jgi:DNA-binding PadR family transcriptional regulator
MSPTRLLVLGVIRFAQPVHGYDIRRELISWQLEESTNVKPGSIYSALRTLERDGLIAVVSHAQLDNRPERTLYELTDEGDKAFIVLLRKAWWTVTMPVEPLIAAMAMFPSMSRQELTGALDSRIDQLRARLRQSEFVRKLITDDDSGVDGGIPEHVREILHFQDTRAQSELEWTIGFRQRLKAGQYRLGPESAWAGAGPGRGVSATPPSVDSTAVDSTSIDPNSAESR